MPPVQAAQPPLSAYFRSRQPSGVRVAGLRFLSRTDGARAINVAIGNVSLPMHPAMVQRMRSLGESDSPFEDGVVRYTTTLGRPDTNRTFLHIIRSSGFETSGLYSQVTDGGSQAMELVCIGVCGPAGSSDRPLMLIDAAYTNYRLFAARLGRGTVSITRDLQEDGRFTLPALDAIEELIATHRPGGLVVIPYDNPTGQFYTRNQLIALARLCVKYDLWFISDEAYRELFYGEGHAVSIWSIGDPDVPGIQGRRVSIETASKVWNACGLRIGALVTDNEEFHRQAVAENTASLCSNHIGQWIFAALENVPHEALQSWYAQLRDYYRNMLQSFTDEMRERLPGVIVSRPDASIYSVVDVRNVASEEFDALDFVLWCAEKGHVDIDGAPTTLLTAPLAGFYSVPPGTPNPGRTQMRIAYVEKPEIMAKVPALFVELFRQYERERS